ncbi:MAG: acetyl-CoA C-acetyltransferase [Candidatus Portnoybacteria bacterium]|nr:acetyl-CoA C-acetyltransferase [Candidatus Portnoybacteria bacterium]
MKKVVIVSAVRTAIGNFLETLKEMPATQLGAIVIAEVLRRAKLEKNLVDEVIMGNVLPAGLGQNPARQAMLRAGLPVSVAALTINKVCGSGLMAIMLAHSRIVSGEADIVVAGGMENMSLVPYYLPNARTGYRMGHNKLIDGMIIDGLWDMISDFHMGYAAELVAKKYGISRAEADEFAAASYQKALAAIGAGNFIEEIVPIEISQKKGNPIIFATDETPQRTSLEILAKLRPVFAKEKNGQVTAGNASKISDGAAAVLVMSEEKAKELEIKSLATIVAQGTAGIELEMILAAPIFSIPETLKKAGLKPDDIDLHEINEAFSTSSVAVIKTLGIDPAKVNVNGGAVALGHPIGASGARVLVTLLYAMKQKDAKRGMASLCLGGGEAVSLIVER